MLDRLGGCMQMGSIAHRVNTMGVCWRDRISGQHLSLDTRGRQLEAPVRRECETLTLT